MNKVHRKVEYALMALKHVAHKPVGALTTAKEVADAYHAPFEAVARSLQILAQKGVLRSEQGAQGGYRLAKSLNEISMYELIEIIEGPTRIAKCLNSGEPCEIQSACNIISPIQNLNLRLSDFYKGVLLQDLLQPIKTSGASI